MLICAMVLFTAFVGMGQVDPSYCHGQEPTTGTQPLRLTGLEVLSEEKELVVVLDFNSPLREGSELITTDSQVILDLPHVQLSEEQEGWIRVRDILANQLSLTRQMEGCRLLLDLNYPGPEVEVVAEEEGYRLKLLLAREFEEESTVMLAEGVYHTRLRKGTVDGPLLINVLRVDPVLSGLRLQPVLARGRIGGLAPLSQIVEDNAAVAGINGSYYADDGTPLGMLLVDGEIVSEGVLSYPTVGITEGQELLFSQFASKVRAVGAKTEVEIDRVNKNHNALRRNELILYNRFFGNTTRSSFHVRHRRFSDDMWELVVEEGRVTAFRQGPGPIPESGFVLSARGRQIALLQELAGEETVRIEFSLPEGWEGVTQALSAGPLLVKDGQLHITEGFSSYIVDERHPRSALGVTAGGEILLVTVDGRAEHASIGMNLRELGDLMIQLGAEHAINLDGGGSTTLVWRERILNTPSDGGERRLPVVLLLKY